MVPTPSCRPASSSRLYRSLVYEQQMAQSAFTVAELQPAARLLMAAIAIMAGGKTAEEGEAALRAEVARLRDDPVTAAELAEAKNELVAAALRERRPSTAGQRAGLRPDLARATPTA